MELEVLNMDLTVCTLACPEDFDPGKDFFFMGRTDNEISLVCRKEDVPEGTLEREAGISIFALSTYQTDYILVREGDFERALDLLSSQGYAILR